MKLLLRSILFCSIASFGPVAFGDPDWTNMGPDDNFNNPANWINIEGANAVPGAADSAHIFPGFFVTTADLRVTPGGPSTITINTSTNENVQSYLVSSNFEESSITNGVLNLNFTGGSTFNVGVDGGVITGAVTVNFTGNQTVAGDLVVGTNASTIDPGEVTGAGTLNLGPGTLTVNSVDGNNFIVGQGATGTVVQNSGSTVIVGDNLQIGEGGAGNAATYTINSGATLVLAAPATSPTIGLVIGDGSSGTLNVLGGTVNGNGAGFASFGGFVVGTADGIGTINQSGASTVGLNGLVLGQTGGTGTYNLMSGNLTINNNSLLDLGTFDAPGTGNLVQTGGALVVGTGTTFEILGGAYTLSGGTADLQNGFGIEGGAGDESASLTQSGGTLTVENGTVAIGGTSGIGTGIGTYNMQGGTATFNSAVDVGSTGAMVPTPGTFNMEGGTATFNSGIVVGATGTVSQTGGTFTITTGQTLDLSAVGASYTLGGTGILQVAHGSLAGTTGEGTLNFGGGTLQMTSAGTFTDGLDGTLTGTSTIDAVTTPGVTSVTMGGNYSGTGGITFAGGAGTTFQFAGTNTYTGPTGISSGTLNATQGNITNSSALNIGATGVLKLTLNAGGFAYAGAIGGTGALKVNFNTAGDPFVVLNTSSFTGPITLGANGTRGTLQVYSGTFGNIGDNGTGSGVEIGGAPLAAFPGGTVTPVTGVVTFGNNTYTGMTTVNSGFTLLASGLGGSVTNNGTLGLATGNAIGSTFNINGDLNQAGGGGSLVVRVNGNQFDNYAATTAELFGKIVVTGTASTAPVTETIVTTTTSLTTGTLNSGGAGGLEAVGSFLLNAVLVPDANPKLLDLTVTQNPIMGQTPNQNAVAVSLNQNPNNPIFAFIDNNPNLTAANAPAILEELTPESLQYARNISFENSTFLAQQVDGWCASLRSGYGGLDTTAINVVAPGFDSGLGRSLGSLLAYDDPAFHPSAPNGVNYYPGGGSSTGGGGSSPASSPASSPPTPTWDSSTQVISDSPNPYMATQNPSGPETPRMSEFIGGDVILADLNQNQSTANAPSSKANYTAADVAAGVSFRMTSHLAAGILFDYNHTDATTDSSGSKTTVDSYSPGLFATYFDHGFYANGIFSFGYNDYSNSRDISFLGENASSHPTGRQYVGDLDGGYDFHPAKGWIVGPTLGVTYTHLDVDSFTETGAPGADLDVNSQSADSLRSRLGAHVLFQTNTGDVLLQPSLTAMWQHEYLDNSSGITSSFNDFSSSPFTIETAAPSRDSALIGCGLTATLSDSLALYINYLADVGADDYFAQSVVGGFKARF